MVIEMDLLAVVQNVGFPIAISLYFIFRTEKVIDRNTNAFEKFSAGNCPLKRKN
jgi:hypothetical protein